MGVRGWAVRWAANFAWDGRKRGAGCKAAGRSRGRGMPGDDSGCAGGGMGARGGPGGAQAGGAGMRGGGGRRGSGASGGRGAGRARRGQGAGAEAGEEVAEAFELALQAEQGEQGHRDLPEAELRTGRCEEPQQADGGGDTGEQVGHGVKITNIVIRVKWV